MANRLFHGSRIEVVNPDIKFSRTDIDFGAGFYLTADLTMACKWACNKQRSILNEYECDLSGIRTRNLVADKEWLDYVVANREGKELPFDDALYDVIIGPTADDKMFNIIDLYTDGLISADNAVKVLNVMNYSEQVVFKKQAALDKALRFVGYKEIFGQEKQHYIDLFKKDREVANERTMKLLREINVR